MIIHSHLPHSRHQENCELIERGKSAKHGVRHLHAVNGGRLLDTATSRPDRLVCRSETGDATVGASCGVAARCAEARDLRPGSVCVRRGRLCGSGRLMITSGRLNVYVTIHRAIHSRESDKDIETSAMRVAIGDRGV